MAARKQEAGAWVRQSWRNEDRPRKQWRWEVVYKDPHDGYKRRTKGGFGSKRAAEVWRVDHLAKVRRGEYISLDQGDVVFRDLACEWLATLTTDKAKTREGYRQIIEGERSRLNLAFGGRRLGDISHAAIARWVGEQSAELAPTTVRNNFYVLRAVLDYAVRTRRLATNPAVGVGLPKVKQQRAREEKRYPLTPGEVSAICDRLPEPWDTYTWLVAWTGMRPEEASALTLGDLDLDSATVRVRAVLVDVNGRLVREDDPKTVKSRRTITLDTATVARLRAYVAAHRQRAMAWWPEEARRRAEQSLYPLGPFPGDDLPLFVGIKTGRANGVPDLERLDFSKPMRHGLFYNRHWKRTIKALGLPPHLRFYDLRHAHVSWLVADGTLGIKEISERVGHSSAVMTLDRYAHVPRDYHDRQRRALDILAEPTTNNVTPLNRDAR